MFSSSLASNFIVGSRACANYYVIAEKCLVLDCI